MFCSKCGKENSDDAVYCQKCGRALEPEEETRVAVKERLVPDARTGAAANPERIFSISPTLKFVYVGYGLAVIGAFLLVGIVSIFLPTTVPVVASVILGMAMLLIPLYYHLRKKLVRYTLTDTTIEIDRGWISQTTQNIPLRRIQDVTVSATMAQRMFGFGDVIIDNASEDGGKVILGGIDAPKKHAELMLRQMRQIER
ncbi:MAG TPA: PH domain-containing protein [Pyrinomonadaceae bacterium]|nr:PH domain-containing protein [Pyrinomonadaceae bacterium]